MNKPRVAIVCDWLTGIGGAERVVLELHKMFPDAPIFTSQYDSKKIAWFDEADVRVGWLQHLPKSLKKFLPVLRSWYFSHLDLAEFDLVISSSGAEAKYVKTEKPTIHFAYIHSPTHYYWSRYDDYLREPGFGKLDWLARLGLKILVKPLRKKDFAAAQRPDYLLANSTHTKEQIKKYYRRDSTVVFPPVDLDRFKHPRVRGERRGFVATGRQTPYKKIDLAVAACTKLDLPLTVIGDGPDHNKLVKMAGPKIRFITNASDQDVANFLAGAEGFIFPNLDDFGISAVEALAAGTPVIAYQAGGALDYIEPGKNGEFLDKQSVSSLVIALKKFRPSNYKSTTVSVSAHSYSVASFKSSVTKLLDIVE